MPSRFFNRLGMAARGLHIHVASDLNESNSVNVEDYTKLKMRWNGTDSAVDINGDGQVQTLDYSIMKSNWFKAGSPE